MKTYTCARKVNDIPNDEGCLSVCVLVFYPENISGNSCYRLKARFVGEYSACEYARWLSSYPQEGRVKVIDNDSWDGARIVAVYENGKEVDPLLFWS